MIGINKRFRDEEGWTFVETLIVLAIALMLTAMVGLAAFKQVDKAKMVKAQTEVENAALALTSYFLDCGVYPTESQGLEALSQKPTEGSIPDNWNGPYLTRRLERDPWGRHYIYRQPGPEGQPFAILSFGSEGLEGGLGENRDIQSW